MSKITYSNKVALNENASIADINKIKDADMNEIKTVVNSNYDEYTSTKHQDVTTDGAGVKCGFKVDGKDVYVKRIYFGSLPNNTTKSVATGIDFSTYTLYEIIAKAKYYNNNVTFPIPFANPSTLGYSIMINLDNSNNIVITTGSDRTNYNAWVNIYYY